MGNDKSVKSVFSGHRVVLLLPRQKTEAQQPKGTKSPKSDLRELRGKIVLLLNLLEELAAGGLKTSRSLRGEIQPAGAAMPLTVSQGSKVLQL